MPTTFMRVTAIAGIAGSAICLLALLMNSLDNSDNSIAGWFYFAGFILLLASVVGLLGTRRKPLNGFAYAGLALALLGLLSVNLFFFLALLSRFKVGNFDWVWNVGIVGLMVAFAGMGLYGVSTLANGALPRWAAIPLGIGGLTSSMLGIILITGADAMPSGTWPVISVLTITVIILALIGWAAATSTLMFKSEQ